jgi:hypothetical protein
MNPALAFTAAALALGLGAYYGTGAVRRYLRGREDARYRIMLAAERRRAEERAERAAAELDKPREGMPPRPRTVAVKSRDGSVNPLYDPCGAPPIGRQP